MHNCSLRHWLLLTTPNSLFQALRSPSGEWTIRPTKTKLFDSLFVVRNKYSERGQLIKKLPRSIFVLIWWNEPYINSKQRDSDLWLGIRFGSKLEKNWCHFDFVFFGCDMESSVAILNDTTNSTSNNRLQKFLGRKPRTEAFQRSHAS